MMRTSTLTGLNISCFNIFIREKDTILNYIRNQKEHHQTETFYDEFKRLLIENGTEFDEKYLG